MFLLNSILIGSYIADDNNTLTIKPFLEENLEHTFYYFRLGSKGKLNGVPFDLTRKKEEKFLELKPNDFAEIQTFEKFTLSGKILGILGQCSFITGQGLQLIHSPFIDPRYNDPLNFGIKNLGNDIVNLEFGVDKIGKVSFFDISDTYPIRVNPDSSFAKRFTITKK